jgi:4-hydroxy-tetrahydrodipicolinate synthase
MITGSIVAIVTPMHEDGSLDFAALRKLVDFHVQEGTDAIVVVGTTGESPTVNLEEHCELIRVTVDHAAGRIPVIAGTGANSTSEAIELTEFAKKAGADMALSVVPYYNRPTQEGMYLHFKAIAERVDLPVLLYNVPGRTVADMSNDTALRLAKVPGIVGIKDATGNLDRACDLIARAPKGFALYSGDDMTCVASILLGFHGNIRSRQTSRRVSCMKCVWPLLRVTWPKRAKFNSSLLACIATSSVRPIQFRSNGRCISWV